MRSERVVVRVVVLEGKAPAVQMDQLTHLSAIKKKTPVLQDTLIEVCMIFLFLDSLSLAATSGNLNYLAHCISGRGNSVPRCCVGQDKLCHTHRRLRVNPKRPSPDITNLHFLLVLGFGPSKVDCHSCAIDIAIFFLEPVVLHWRSGNIEGGAPGSEGPDAN